MPPVTLQTPIQFNDRMPDQVDVVVIGGGVAGVCTAWFLNEAGVSVFVCEKGRVAGEQSSRNWGWVRQQGRDEAELPIMMDSIHHWDTLNRELGKDIGFERHGTLYIAESEKELERLEGWIEIAEQHQLDSRMLSAREIDDLVQGNAGNWCGGVFTPGDGHAEAFTAVPAIARRLQEKGVGIRENCAARVLDLTAGSVTGVHTEKGLIRASSVVLAAGAWSTVFLRNMGIRLPQLVVRSTVGRTQQGENFFSGNAADSHFAFRHRQDGGYTIAPGGVNEHFISFDSFRFFRQFQPVLRRSARDVQLRFGPDLLKRLMPRKPWSENEVSPFESERVLDPAAADDGIRRMRKGLERHLPPLANVPFEECWAGMIDVTPDVVPVMDEVDEYPGLYVSTGFSGHGFGIGPGAGETMADMVLGRPARHDLHRFRFSRFSDGSAMEPGPGL